MQILAIDQCIRHKKMDYLALNLIRGIAAAKSGEEEELHPSVDGHPAHHRDCTL
jgi:hypothetical protein